MAGLEQRRELGNIDAGDEHASPGDDLDEVLPGETLERLPDGCSADVQPFLEFVFAQDVARCQVELDDLAADLLVGLLAQRRRG